MPEDHDADATHTLAVVATRDLGDQGLDRFHDNDVTNFLSSGAETVTPPRDIVRTETCNRCHDSQSAASHAVSNSRDIGEARASCHDPGKTCGVEKVHARQYGQTRQDRILPTNETGRFGALSCLGAASAKWRLAREQGIAGT